MPAVLRRLLEEKLVAKAHAQHRLAAPGQLDQLAAQAVSRKLGQRGREGADAGQDDAIGPRKVIRVGREASLRADLHQGALDRSDVAYAVIDDGDHPSSPFEEGAPGPPPDATAARKARPRALKVASAMWCRFRPRSRST